MSGLRYWATIGGTSVVDSRVYPYRVSLPFPTPKYRIEITEAQYRELLSTIWPGDIDGTPAPDFTPPPLDWDHHFYTSHMRHPGHWANGLNVFCSVEEVIA